MTRAGVYIDLIKCKTVEDIDRVVSDRWFYPKHFLLASKHYEGDLKKKILGLYEESVEEWKDVLG